MGTYSRDADRIDDRRRATRLAQRMADASRDPIGDLVLRPGVVNADSAAFNQILASGVNFDRAGFAYDLSNHGAYTVNGASDGTATHWTKVGANADNLRLPIGAVDHPLYVWVWSTFGWSLDAASTAAHGRAVVCLYDSLEINAAAIVRATNPMSGWVASDSHFRTVPYIGFIAIDPDDPIITGADGYTGQGDWNVGMQHQYEGTQKASSTTVNRQSLTAFVTAFPPDGATNVTVDSEIA